jgi:hypothetical protein
VGVVYVWRAIAAGVSVIAAAVAGVVTVLVTAHSSWGLWVALGVVVILGATLQAAITYSDHKKAARVKASGVGAVAVGGSAQGEIRTRVRGKHVPVTEADEQDGVGASGPGSVSVGGDAAGPISTDVADDEGPAT